MTDHDDTPPFSSADEEENKNRKYAVALGYSPENEKAPGIRAKGRGYVADEIIAAAKANAIPVQEDESLVQLLSELEINQQIPDSLYQVVAEVFAFIYRIDREQTERSKME
ncbi:EscU/YscU/HrcU family type III secretion system export apparatus switch protein [Salisediminibacterium halotolerans]|uniref:Flagellar biosynthesis protein n=1 Tax=Salisediminibacterium halotolerans TaxID=517425 RepID=A0A1H9Q2Y0_9BACI|nr:EscU/YscU/HrcU family type III secretion system export apparatus switch protein [Salisediminibacterium haloalkalitolerans]SER54319.1 flagellar biosynthesis protein [Salisediminibacterium haloalkalitolerans]